MEVKKVRAVFMSPEGNTKKVVTYMAEQLAACLQVPFTLFDATAPGSREELQEFEGTELAIIGVPTYAGRVPNKLLPYIQEKFVGNDALLIPVVTFGNRNFDNSLKELCEESEKNGFHTVAAAAVASQHAFSDHIAFGRPDEKDYDKLHAFTEQAARKIEELQEIPAPVEVSGEYPAAYYTPLGTDGQPAVFLKAKPQTHAEDCIHCGICVKACPMGSIDAADETLVPGVCIKCQACVKKCPTKAKYFDDAAFLSHVGMLEQNYTERFEPKFFL